MSEKRRVPVTSMQEHTRISLEWNGVEHTVWPVYTANKVPMPWACVITSPDVIGLTVTGSFATQLGAKFAALSYIAQRHPNVTARCDQCGSSSFDIEAGVCVSCGFERWAH
jgi:hypothetical protein